VVSVEQEFGGLGEGKAAKLVVLLINVITLSDLRRYAIAKSLFAPTTLKRAIERMGFVQADPIRATASESTRYASMRRGRTMPRREARGSTSWWTWRFAFMRRYRARAWRSCYAGCAMPCRSGTVN
jgi:hypothetical protein